MDESEKLYKQLEDAIEILNNASSKKINYERARTELRDRMEKFPENTVNGEYDEEYLENARNYVYWEKQYEDAMLNVKKAEKKWAKARGLVELNNWIDLKKYIEEYDAVFDHFDFDRRRFVVRFGNDKSNE